MKPLFTLALLIAIVGDTGASERVIEFVPSHETQAYKEKNELLYEVLRFYSVPHQHQLARLNLAALEIPGTVVEFDLVPDKPAVKIISNGVTRSTDRWGRWTGTIVHDTYLDDLDKDTRRVFETVSLGITTWIYSPELDQYFEPPAKFNKSDVTDWNPGDPAFFPFPVGPNTKIVHSVSGEFDLSPVLKGFGIYAIEQLDRKDEIVMISELDRRKRWHITESAPAADTDAGRRYRQQQKDLAIILDAAKVRIADRNKNND